MSTISNNSLSPRIPGLNSSSDAFSKISDLSTQLLQNEYQSKLNSTMQTVQKALGTREQSDSAAINTTSYLGRLNTLDHNLDQAQQAKQTLDKADSALAQIGTQLTDLRELVVQAQEDETGQYSYDELQVAVNQAVSDINSIAEQTTYNGNSLLDGSYQFRTANQSPDVEEVALNYADAQQIGRAVEVDITQSAQSANLYLNFDDATELSLSADEATLALELTGNNGTQVFEFDDGESLAGIAAVINTGSEETGLTAEVSGNDILVRSNTTGSDQFISIRVVDDAGQVGNVYTAQANDENTRGADQGTLADLQSDQTTVTDEGQDIQATWQGQTIDGTGNQLNFRTDRLYGDLTLDESRAQQTGAFEAFTITGGGANFIIDDQVSRYSFNNATADAIGEVTDDQGNTYTLEDLVSGADAELINGENSELALQIIDQAIADIDSQRSAIARYTSSQIDTAIDETSEQLDALSETEAVADQMAEAQALSYETRESLLQSILDTQNSDNATNTPLNFLAARLQPINIMSMLG